MGLEGERIRGRKGCEGGVQGLGNRIRKRRGVRGPDWRKRRVWLEEEKGC